MSFRTGPCCNCCGQAWAKPLGGGGPGFTIYTRNPDYRPSVVPQVELFYSGSGSPSGGITGDYLDLVDPLFVGWTSLGDAIIYADDENLYRLKPYPPYELSLLFASTSDIAVDVVTNTPSEIRQICYHDDWGYGCSAMHYGTSLVDTFTFDSDGDRVNGSDDITYAGLDAQTNFCTDSEGNLYWLGFPIGDEQSSVVGMNASTIVSDEFPWVQRRGLIHTGEAPYISYYKDGSDTNPEPTNGIYRALAGEPGLELELNAEAVLRWYNENFKRAYGFYTDSHSTTPNMYRFPYIPSIDRFPPDQAIELDDAGPWLIEWQ